MKQIYNFNVKVDGRDVKVVVKKPLQSEVEISEYVYSQKFNELIKAGFLSRAQMDKKNGDIGGPYSKQTIDDLGKAIEKLSKCEKTIQFFDGAETLTDEQGRELQKAKDIYTNIQYNIANMDRNIENMYQNSADQKAEEHLIKWLVLQMAYYVEVVSKDGEPTEEYFSIFDGDTFAAKLESYVKFLDADDEDAELTYKQKIAAESITIISRIVNIWYNGYGATPEKVEEHYLQFFDEEIEPKEEEEETPSPPKKKTASKKKDEG